MKYVLVDLVLNLFDPQGGAFACLFIDDINFQCTIYGVQGSFDPQGLRAKTGTRCVMPLRQSKAETAPATVSGEHRSDLNHWG